MNILYRSTRSDAAPITASAAILKGLSPDGGLFVPETIPALKKPLSCLAGLSYQELAYEIMSAYFTDFTEEELRSCIENAYDSKFDTEKIAPLVKKDGLYYLELFHGSTIAFKDMALSILPHLMVTSARKNGVKNEIVILTATSGDTGKAAMAGFADVPGTKIIVFYPHGGVSNIQRLQMATQRGENTHVAAINGNFDDAQTAVKKMFNDKALAAELSEHGFQFSSANSINIGRLVPQIVYYVYAYCQLLSSGEIAEGDFINITVPTGNFGNILAAYYAKLMGLPVRKLICASNKNKVLTDFFDTGLYDRKRPFMLTSSPSMDILISSNLERLIYRLTGNDSGKTLAFMQDLTDKGSYTITDEMREGLGDFVGGCASEEENFAGIKALYERTGYVIDTHTGIANAVCRAYMEKTGDTTPTVIASTASPFKFAEAVVGAIAPEKLEGKSDFELIDLLSDLSGTKEPYAITDIRTAPVRHKTVVDAEDMPADVKQFLGI
ncbi:MAG: threonine synthase [Lachnospiraceae bacterium]|nr:threonine synthase [Lachnospiraceae bacterium]